MKNKIKYLFAVFLMLSFVLIGSSSKVLGEIGIIILCTLSGSIFFYWLVFQYYDFDDKKFKNPSLLTKLLVSFTLVLIGVESGGVIGATIITLGFLVIFIRLSSKK